MSRPAAADDPDRGLDDRRADLLQLGMIGGQTRPGGSSWQSLRRGTGDIETDYLNGEIVFLGRMHGVATPANAMIQRLARELEGIEERLSLLEEEKEKEQLKKGRGL